MRQLIYVLLGTVLFSCGSIKKYKKEDLKPLTSAKEIEGEYMNYVNDSLQLFHRSLNGELNWRRKDIDSTAYTSVKIAVIDDKRLKFDFLLEGKTLKTKIITYRLRNNGFLKLRNNNFRISGIPLIIGEYEVIKFEIGLNTSNNLILHGVDDQAGGLLIILSSGINLELNNVYKRI